MIRKENIKSIHLKWKKMAIGAMAAVMTLCSVSVTALAETGYTYTYDYWGDVQYSPDTYKVLGVYTATELGLEDKLSSPQGLFINGRRIFICDTGNNRILEYERTDDDSLKLIRIIDSFQAEEGFVNTFNGPTDVALSEDGDLFIADKENNRIVKLDEDLNLLLVFTKPEDETYDQSLSFQPSKITVDSAGRVYCVATNVNKGLVKYENDGTFTGFVGAIPVTFDFADYVQKRLATQAQRDAMASFVPTEYDNLYMDYEGFIYVCSTHVTEADLDAGTINPIRKLNLMGNDILVRNGDWPIFGDLYWGSGGGYKGPSMLNDITVMENDVYCALDRTRGRIFAYDDQGRMLFCFGGRGNMDGYFKQPTAIEHMGHDLFVLDALDSSITIFTPTAYGQTIFNAIEQFEDGKYEESGESWKEVMASNGNYDLAYIGIGRSLLRQEKYEESMEYFKLKMDDENYSKAFKQYRKIWVEEHIQWIVIVLLILIAVPMIIGKIRSVRREIDNADIFGTDGGES